MTYKNKFTINFTMIKVPFMGSEGEVGSLPSGIPTIIHSQTAPALG
jgi:hypothetical protein